MKRSQSEMDGGGGFARAIGMGLMNQRNYMTWKTCMQSYLKGEDLWEVVGGDATVEVVAAGDNGPAVRAWAKTNGKAEFALKRTISSELFEHITNCKSAAEIWTTLDGLFNKKNVARLQFLENELARTTQGEMSISAFFLKVQNQCTEIPAPDAEEPLS